MHPVLFELPAPWGAQPIYAYGVMLGLSLILGWQILMTLGRRAGLASGLLGDVYLTTVVSGLVGARVLYVWINSDEFSSVGQWFDLRGGGLVAYGGFLGGFLGALVHLRLKQTSLLDVGDAAAPAIALGLFFTRIGCYLYGCDYGKRLTDSAPDWLARLGRFPRWTDDDLGMRGAPAFIHHVNAYDLAPNADYSFPVHPVQLYEGLLGLALTAALVVLFYRRQFEGQVLLLLTVVYGIGRFMLEFLRDDPERGSLFGFSTSQLISLALVPAAAVAYSLLAKRARQHPALG
jgi:phosphatidylglycerol---prolipoprotein diacylglyceryl transferase